MSIQCKSCGNFLEDNVKFCRYCGTPVEQPAQAYDPNMMYNQQAPQQLVQGFDPNMMYNQNVQQQATQGFDPNMYNQQAQQQATQGYTNPNMANNNQYGPQQMFPPPQNGGGFQQNIYIGTQQQLNTGSRFDGTVLDTLLVSIAASLIAGITFGIATPWALCIMWNFIVSHVIVDGKRLYFDGNGAQLFGNWIKWFILTIITFGIYGFWVAPKLFDWVAKHTHFQN